MSAPTQRITNNVAPAEYAAAVTKSDSTVLNPFPRALYIGSGGEAVARSLGGTWTDGGA